MKKLILIMIIGVFASCEATYWDCTRVKTTTNGVVTYSEICYEVEY